MKSLMVLVRKSPALRAILCLFTILSFLPAQAERDPATGNSPEDIPASSLFYISDYVSFVGQDSQGKVALALDNSRGRDGDAYQAEHLVRLHDDGQGWIDLEGNGRYDNSGKALKTIPQSPSFRFSGMPYTGMTIVSERNRLSLKIDPIKRQTRKRLDGAAVSMGTAQAVLTWRGRTIPGRVIYESFMMPNFNRLTHTYWDMWNEYQGFYLRMDNDGDVYLHSQKSERLSPLMGFLDGFLTWQNETEVMNDLNVEVLDRELAWGLYRWPTAWRVTWVGSQGAAVVTLKQVSRTNIGNWAVGGFAMVLVRGELSYAGTQRTIYGLVEVIL